MNCLEFHREKLADPRRLSDAALAHARQCHACAAFAAGVDEAERDLEATLSVPVPDGFADRMILASRERQPRPRVLWALAASLALAVAIGISWVAFQPAEAYARLAIEHVAHEPDFLTAIDRPDPDAFRRVVDNFGGRLNVSLGDIRTMKLCPVEEGVGWHLVLETPEGLATLILVPGKKLARAQRASLDGWNALARPARGGYYVVVTPSDEATTRVDRLVRDRVDWDV
jgi:hypothetical protein